MNRSLLIGFLIVASVSAGCARASVSAGTPPSTVASSQSPSPFFNVGNAMYCGSETDPRLPKPSACISRARGNFDGADSNEEFVVYAVPCPGCSPKQGPEWRWRLYRAGKLLIDSSLSAVLPVFEPAVLSASDVNGDGRDEALLRVEHGASTVFLTFVQVSASGLVAATVDGHVAMFATQGSVTHIGAIACLHNPPGLEVYSMTAFPPASPSFIVVNYRWQGMKLVKVGERSGPGDGGWGQAPHPSC